MASLATPNNNNGSGELVAKPAINAKNFESLQSSRFDKIFLYYEKKQPDDFRYQLSVVDRPLLPTAHLTHVTAVVLIPAGRETEYIFSSKRGLLSVAESAGCGRLIAVSFGRNHVFESQAAVQEELTFVVQVISQQGNFLPLTLYKRHSKNLSIVFMALDGIGSRNVLAEGETKLSGKYLVEQVKAEGNLVRRLYFMDNPFVIQSESVLIGETTTDTTVNKAHLAFPYHKQMCAGLLGLNTTETRNESDESTESMGVVIGLGGGGLVTFLQYMLPTTKLTIVELDESVVPIAEKYFGFERNENTAVRIGDGLKVGKEEDEGIPIPPTSCSFIVLDVDSKDKSVGMSCPPQAFIETEYLETLKGLLQPGGVLAINVSARDPEMFQLALDRVESVFASVFVTKDDEEESQEDLNCVIFASAEERKLGNRTELRNRLRTNLKPFTESTTRTTTSPPPTPKNDAKEAISELEESLTLIKPYPTPDKSTEPATKNKKGGNKKKGGNNKKKKGKKR